MFRIRLGDFIFLRGEIPAGATLRDVSIRRQASDMRGAERDENDWLM